MDYVVPYNYPNQLHIRRDQLAALQEVSLINQNALRLTQREIDIINGHKLLKFMRNRLAHRMEAIQAGYTTWNQQFQYNFSAISSETVTRVNFL